MTHTSSPPQASIRSVAVIGAGSAGRSFALACAAAGFNVVLEDVMPANLRRAQEAFSSAHEPGAPSRKAGWEKNRGSLAVALTIEDAVRSADLVVDFVPDELESKLEIFSMVDRMAPPRTILLTPTDALSIADLASCTYRPERCFAVRCLAVRNGLAAGAPAHLVHPAGADEHTLAAISAFLRSLSCEVRIAVDTAPPMLIKNQQK